MNKLTLLFIVWVVLVLVAYVIVKQSIVEPTSTSNGDIPHMNPSIIGGWLR